MQHKLQKKLSSLKRKMLVGAAMAGTSVLSAPAMAFTAPAAGDLGYAFYDTLINEGVSGPIGFTIAVLATIFGFYSLTQRNWFMAIGSFAGTTAMVAGGAIVTSLGMVV